MKFVIDKLSKWSDKYKTILVDYDLCRDTAKYYSIKRTPAFVFLKSKEKVNQIDSYLVDYENSVRWYLTSTDGDGFLDHNELPLCT